MKNPVAGMAFTLLLAGAYTHGVTTASAAGRYRCKRLATEYDVEQWVDETPGQFAFTVEKVICFKS